MKINRGFNIMSYQSLYQYNPLFDSPAKQVAFLFKKIAEFIEDAEENRDKGNFETFSYLYQRAFSLTNGLLSWLEEERIGSGSQIDHGLPSSWKEYFENIIRAMQKLVLEENKSLLHALIQSLHSMAQTWSNLAAEYEISVGGSASRSAEDSSAVMGIMTLA